VHRLWALAGCCDAWSDANCRAGGYASPSQLALACWRVGHQAAHHMASPLSCTRSRCRHAAAQARLGRTSPKPASSSTPTPTSAPGWRDLRRNSTWRCWVSGRCTQAGVMMTGHGRACQQLASGASSTAAPPDPPPPAAGPLLHAEPGDVLHIHLFNRLPFEVNIEPDGLLHDAPAPAQPGQLATYEWSVPAEAAPPPGGSTSSQMWLYRWGLCKERPYTRHPVWAASRWRLRRPQQGRAGQLQRQPGHLGVCLRHAETGQDAMRCRRRNAAPPSRWPPPPRATIHQPAGSLLLGPPTPCRSTVDRQAHAHAGLVGPLVVARPGELQPNNRQLKDVDREVVLVMHVSGVCRHRHTEPAPPRPLSLCDTPASAPGGWAGHAGHPRVRQPLLPRPDA